MPSTLLSMASVLLLLLSAPALAGSRDSVEFLFGGALNASTPLSIDQEGESRVEIDAEYSTRPFELPVYYTVRVARGDSTGAWEVQLIHHKLYLENTTTEVEHFEITHGFNILTVNRAFDARSLDLRVGAGVVLGHTESRVRGQTTSGGGILDTGYELAGPALILGAGKRIRLSERWQAGLEAQATLGRATVSIANGEAATTNVALHIMFGIGYAW